MISCERPSHSSSLRRTNLELNVGFQINKAANIHDLANIEQNKKSLDVLKTACSYLHRHYIEREAAEDIVTLCRRKFLEARHEKVLDNPLWLGQWLQDAVDSVVDGTEPT